MVYALAIENSTKYLSIASGDCEKQCIFNYDYYHEIHINNASNVILEKIQLILSKNIKIPEYITLGIGPGSFTGIRLAISIATGLSIAWNIKIIPICSLLCAIESFRCGYTNINTNTNISNSWHNTHNRIILDARMEEVYTRMFNYNYIDNKYILGKIELLKNNYIFDNEHQSIILTNIEERVKEGNNYFTVPHALGLLSLTYANIDKACYADKIQPNYIRNKIAYTIAERKI